MALRRSLALVLAVALASLATGCAADAESEADDALEVDELNGSLRHVTVLRGSMTAPGTMTVTYEPSAYALPGSTVPFLAIELPAGLDVAEDGASSSVRPLNASAGARFSVKVNGDFPGTPRVIVTDESFRPLAATRGRTTVTGADEASVQLPTTRGKKLVLVRDMLWVRPMQFDVTVSR